MPLNWKRRPRLAANPTDKAPARIRRMARVGAVSLCGLALHCVAPDTARAQAPAAAPAPAGMRAFDIPNGELGPALRRFASDANVLLTFTEDQTAGKTTPGIRGQYTTDAALAALLTGSGLSAEPLGNGGYTLRVVPAGRFSASASQGVSRLQEVVVRGEREDGGEEGGYVVAKPSSIGPWEGRSLQDTPYSLHVVTRQQIENLQPTSVDDIIEVVPTAQLSWPQAQNDAPYVFIRGFQATTSLRNGLGGAMYGHGTTTEDVERVETLSGLSGFMYGAGNVGGVINYVAKRPTATPYRSVGVSYANDSNVSLRGDFGGPIDAAGKFGYRVNVVGEDGELDIDGFHRRKKFISAAFDWHVTDKLLLQVDGSYRDFHSSRQAYWSLGSGVQRPSADSIDPSLLWSQPWTFFDVESKRLGANLNWELGQNTRLRGGLLQRDDTRTYAFSTNTILANGTYNQVNRITSPQRIKGHAYNVYLDHAFNTGSVSHKVTLGYMASRSTRYDYDISAQVSNNVRGLPLSSPTYVAEPDWGAYGLGPSWNDNIEESSSLMIGDDITFNKNWSLLVGANYATIKVRERDDYDAPWETAYRESALTPTVSLIYKPREYATVYATYIESLEEGAIAGDVYRNNPVVNAGEVMPPLKSKQKELGAKMRLGGVNLAAALFEINKGLQYYDVTTPSEPIYVQDGRQVHRGLEFSVGGRLTPSFSLTGGIVLLDPKIKEQKQNPALEGLQPAGTARRMFKLSGEYRVPGVNGLTLSAGINLVGNRWGNTDNTDKLPGYGLVNAGVRYAWREGSYPITLRLNVNNLTDKRYWANGQFLGASRSVRLSATMAF